MSHCKADRFSTRPAPASLITKPTGVFRSVAVGPNTRRRSIYSVRRGLRDLRVAPQLPLTKVLPERPDLIRAFFVSSSALGGSRRPRSLRPTTDGAAAPTSPRPRAPTVIAPSIFGPQDARQTWYGKQSQHATDALYPRLTSPIIRSGVRQINFLAGRKPALPRQACRSAGTDASGSLRPALCRSCRRTWRQDH